MEWFEEILHERWQQRIRVERVLYHSRTDHQELLVFESRDWGRVLALDGVLQLTTADEFAYHEMLAHPPILAHGRVRHVCIVGGGDGGTLREVVKHATVEKITQVEIDRAVIEFCRQWLPQVSAGAFDDPRLDLVIADAAVYMQQDGPKFDVIIVDSTDPRGPGAVLFTEAFYRACRARLAPGGILVTQCGNPAIEPGEFVDTQLAKRAAGFADVSWYLTVVPTYIGGFMTLGWASDDPTRRRVRLDTLKSRPVPAGLRYYTPEMHVAAFVSPPWIPALLEKQQRATPI